MLPKTTLNILGRKKEEGKNEEFDTDNLGSID